MSMLPAAPSWAGKGRGTVAVGASLAIGALSMLVAGSASAGETAADVIKKMAANYTNAKTYQVSVTTVQSGKTKDGKPFSVTQTEHIQYQSPNIFHKSVKASGTGEAAKGQAALQLAVRQGEIFSDGKTAVMYVPSKKMYQKNPVPPTVQLAQLVDLLRAVPPTNQPGLTLLPTTATVQGRSAYVIEVKPTAPPTLKPADKPKFDAYVKQFKQFPRLMIDKQNFNLLEYTVVVNGGSTHSSLSSQIFGAAIPANHFTFSPPPGAKEFKAPPQGAVPGAPGGIPGGAPGGRPK
jgi:outer membrane lipoprotein-sorting protein